MGPTELLASPPDADRRSIATQSRVADLAFTGPAGAPAVRAATNLALLAGAALVAGSGLIHLYLWADGYRHIATIGPLFLAQGIVGLVLAVLLVAYPRVGVAAAAAGYLLATLAAFTVSAAVGLFGFQDTLDAPWAANALLVETAGLACLVVGVVLPLRARRGS